MPRSPHGSRTRSRRRARCWKSAAAAAGRSRPSGASSRVRRTARPAEPSDPRGAPGRCAARAQTVPREQQRRGGGRRVVHAGGVDGFPGRGPPPCTDIAGSSRGHGGAIGSRALRTAARSRAPSAARSCMRGTPGWGAGGARRRRPRGSRAERAVEREQASRRAAARAGSGERARCSTMAVMRRQRLVAQRARAAGAFRHGMFTGGPARLRVQHGVLVERRRAKHRRDQLAVVAHPFCAVTATCRAPPSGRDIPGRPSDQLAHAR